MNIEQKIMRAICWLIAIWLIWAVLASVVALDLPKARTEAAQRKAAQEAARLKAMAPTEMAEGIDYSQETGLPIEDE